MKLFVLCALPALCTAVHACINDRDSDALALQAGRVPEAVRVITGRFDRNPPRYYAMRLEHAQRQLRAQPGDWKLYDDIGASLDRLGRDTEALQWMERKRAAMPPYNFYSPASRDAWYRYYANAGTFRAHRWLHSGANPATRVEMAQAHNFIRRALKINPRAHFNRERYQLLVMEWILRRSDGSKRASQPEALSSFLRRRLNWEDTEERIVNEEASLPRRRAAAEGLAGLIVLGAAWESPDVFEALSRALDSPEGAGLAYLAQLRTEELLRSGHRSFCGLTADDMWNQRQFPQYGVGLGVNEKNRATLDKLYPQLRNEAEAWSRSRESFMLARFAQHRHPDWDSTFWNGWKPAVAPKFDVAWFMERTGQWDEKTQREVRQKTIRQWVAFGGLLGLCLVCLGVTRWWFTRNGVSRSGLRR